MTAKIKIDNNIPVPRSGRISEIVMGLKPGQSVLFREFTSTTQLSGTLGYLRLKHNLKLTTRKEKEGVRVWRNPDE